MLNKIDLLPPGEADAAAKKILKALRWRGRGFRISAMTGEGCKELVGAIMTQLETRAKEGR